MFNFLKTYLDLSPDNGDAAFELLFIILAVTLVVLLGLLWFTRSNPT